MKNAERVEVTYIVNKRDILFMYLDSWAARLVAAPGASIILLAVLSFPNSDASQLRTDIWGLCFGSALLILAPLTLVLWLPVQYGDWRLVGKEVRLVFDRSGVKGWPLWPNQERVWLKMGKPRRCGGVITLPFHSLAGGTRIGWLMIPERALSPAQFSQIQSLLPPDRALPKQKQGAGHSR